MKHDCRFLQKSSEEVLSKEEVKRLDCPSWQILISFRIPGERGKENKGAARTTEVSPQAHSFRKCGVHKEHPLLGGILCWLLPEA